MSDYAWRQSWNPNYDYNNNPMDYNAMKNHRKKLETQRMSDPYRLQINNNRIRDDLSDLETKKRDQTLSVPSVGIPGDNLEVEKPDTEVSSLASSLVGAIPVVGSLFGGGMALASALGHNKKIDSAVEGLDDQIEGIGKSIKRTESRETDTINRGSSQSTDLMNRYAMSKDPNKSQGFMQMYGGNLENTHRNVNKLRDTREKLSLQRGQLQAQRDALEGTKKEWWQTGLDVAGGLFGGFGMGTDFMQSLNTQGMANRFQNALGGMSDEEIRKALLSGGN